MSLTRNSESLLKNLDIKPKDRMMEILSSENPMEIVQEMDPADFYMLVHDVGLSDALELVGYATGEQFQVCLDFETWKGDNFDESRLLPWVEALLEQENEDFERIFDEMDPEILAFFLHKNINIYAPENKDDEVDIPDEEGRITRQSPDMTYWITYPEEGEASEVLQAFINKLYSALDVERAWSYLESMNWEMCTDLLEKMYYFRSKRIQDYGFLPIEEAMEIFHVENPETLRMRLLDEMQAEHYFADHVTNSPFVKALVPLEKEKKTEKLFIHQIGDLLDREAFDNFIAQTVSLGQAVAVCDHVEPCDIDSMAGSFLYAINTASLGLEFLSKENKDLAAKILSKIPLKRIFNAGYCLTYQLGETFKVIMHRGRLSIIDNEPMSLLTDAQRDVVLGLLEERPRPFYSTLDCFTTMRDVENASLILADIAFRELLVFGLLKKTKDDITRIAYDYELVRGIENLNFDNLLLTMFVQRARGLDNPFVPFDADEPCSTKAEMLAAIAPEALESFLPGYATKSMQTSFERMIQQLRAKIEEEYPAKSPEPEFISLVLFAED